MNTQAKISPVTGIRSVGIVGLGHVGSALAELLSGCVPVSYVDPAREASRSLSDLVREADVIFVCVPTPQRADESGADLSIVERVVDEIRDESRRQRCRPIVVIKSTVPPGTTRRMAEKSPELGIVFCPEFMRERHALDDLKTACRVIIGAESDPDYERVVRELSGFFSEVFPSAEIVVSSYEEAELAKYATNAFLALKVTFANQMFDLCRKSGLNYEEFRRLFALDPRVGESHLAVPGPDGHRGFGGSCLPKDLSALGAYASQVGAPLSLLDEASRYNSTIHPDAVGKGITEA